MAVTVQPGYYVGNGTISRGELYASGSRINDLPIQSDQIDGRRWIRPGNTADVVRPANFVTSISGKKKAYGGNQFTWPMMNMSPKMTDYIFETYFDEDYSAELTVQTFNRATGEWEAYWAIGQFPNVAEQAEPLLGGYNELQINFVYGRTAPDGPDLSVEDSYFSTSSTCAVVLLPVEITADIENVGDARTYDDITWDYPFPEDTLYSDFTVPVTWTRYWSFNGTAYKNYNTDPPTVDSEVHYLRAIRSSAMNAADSSTFTIGIIPTASGAKNHILSVSTEGDIYAGNETITLVINPVGRAWNNGFSSGFGNQDQAFGCGFDQAAFGMNAKAWTNGFDGGFG